MKNLPLAIVLAVLPLLLTLGGCGQEVQEVVVPEPSAPEVIEKTACLQVVLDSEIRSKGKDLDNWSCHNGEDSCLSQDIIYAETFEGNGKCTKWDKKRCYTNVNGWMREIKCGCVLNCLAIDE